jgi:vacuolar-type H+-ATPase subunit E/Vma4
LGFSTVPSKAIRRSRSPLERNTASQDSAIESLRNELLDKINGQANDIKQLQASNVELQACNKQLSTTVQRVRHPFTMRTT